MISFEREWRRRFESFARGHQEEHLISGWSESGLRRRVELVRNLLALRPPGDPGRALDLGCGGGTYVRLLSSQGHRVVGFDYSRPSLERSLAADERGVGRYVQGEAYHLPFRREGFDLVLAIGIFQALGDPERALEEIATVLRPGGHVLLEALNSGELVARIRRMRRAWRRKEDPVRSYSPVEIERWLTARGFETIRCAALYLPPRHPAWLTEIVERTRVLHLAAGVPVLGPLGAHAYITLARKTGGDAS
jgi:SAM-dependent methyltransferase